MGDSRFAFGGDSGSDNQGNYTSALLISGERRYDHQVHEIVGR